MRAKIAISLPPRTFATLERKSRELKKSRSAIITEALEALFTHATLTAEERRYVAAYVTHPGLPHRRYVHRQPGSADRRCNRSRRRSRLLNCNLTPPTQACVSMRSIVPAANASDLCE